MSALTAQDQHLKDLLKQAMLELLDERRDLFSEIFAEAIEDAGLVNAIKEGQAGYNVSKKDVLKILGE
jgi:hypothetical protein